MNFFGFVAYHIWEGCLHDRVSSVVLSFCDLLANSTAGAGAVSDRMVASATVSCGWNRCAWSTCIGLGRSHAPGSLAERSVSIVERLRISSVS